MRRVLLENTMRTGKRTTCAAPPPASAMQVAAGSGNGGAGSDETPRRSVQADAPCKPTTRSTPSPDRPPVGTLVDQSRKSDLRVSLRLSSYICGNVSNTAASLLQSVSLHGHAAAAAHACLGPTLSRGAHQGHEAGRVVAVGRVLGKVGAVVQGEGGVVGDERGGGDGVVEAQPAVEQLVAAARRP